jgi:hypothetical protein
MGVGSSAMPEPCVRFYRVAPAAVQLSGAGQVPSSVACRCCPGGASRSRRRRRYPSGMSDAEWAVCEPVLRHPGWRARAAARPGIACAMLSTASAPLRTTDRSGGRCPPASRPPGASITGPPNGTPTGLSRTMHGQLRDRVRQVAGRKTAPTAAVIDSQSVKDAEEVARTRNLKKAFPEVRLAWADGD